MTLAESPKSFFYHPKLNAHKAIGVDIDSTLIHGPNSFFLQRWVEEHHKQVELHLVTFRNGRDFDMIAQDIGAFGMDLSMFHGVHGMPKELGVPFWELLSRVGERGSKSEQKWLRGLKHHKVTVEHYEELYNGVSVWKGLKCKELGLTALVDDLKSMVLPGCELHGIEFIDALNLND